MRVDQHRTHLPRLIRRSVLDERPKADDKPSSARTASRFQQRFEVTEEQRRGLERTLQRLRIGDDGARQIFIAALEYQIGAYREQLVFRDGPECDDDKADSHAMKRLEAVSHAAKALAVSLAGLPAANRAALDDELHNPEHQAESPARSCLTGLEVEIARLVQACGSTASDAARHDAGSTARQIEFVATLARVFSECFEQTATPDPNGAFQGTLQALTETIGVELPTGPSSLTKALATNA